MRASERGVLLFCLILDIFVWRLKWKFQIILASDWLVIKYLATTKYYRAYFSTFKQCLPVILQLYMCFIYRHYSYTTNTISCLKRKFPQKWVKSLFFYSHDGLGCRFSISHRKQHNCSLFLCMEVVNGIVILFFCHTQFSEYIMCICETCSSKALSIYCPLKGMTSRQLLLLIAYGVDHIFHSRL